MSKYVTFAAALRPANHAGDAGAFPIQAMHRLEPINKLKRNQNHNDP